MQWPGAKDDTLSGANTASGVFGMQPARCLPPSHYMGHIPLTVIRPRSPAPLLPRPRGGLSPRGALPAWYGILHNAASCASQAGAKTQNWNNNTEEFVGEICPFHSGNVSHREEKCVKSLLCPHVKGEQAQEGQAQMRSASSRLWPKKVLMLTGEAELVFTDKILVCGCENVAGGKFRQKW